MYWFITICLYQLGTHNPCKTSIYNYYGVFKELFTAEVIERYIKLLLGNKCARRKELFALVDASNYQNQKGRTRR